MRNLVAPLAVLLLASFAAAQESTSFKLSEYVFNAGGVPAGGVIPDSASFQITSADVGEDTAGIILNSSSFAMVAGFGLSYPPPGEVLNLVLLADDITLEWSPEKSGGDYNLYRDVIGNLSGSDYGDCEEQNITDETTTHNLAPTVAEVAFYYLVTAENRLGEEGILGEGFPGSRPNNFPCP
jgi:hypothetical protein